MTYPPAILAILFCASISLSQNNSPDPYKTSLDRLDSLTHQGETEWRFHADIPHPEDPSIDDSGWGTWTVKNVSGPGGRMRMRSTGRGHAYSGAGCRFPTKFMDTRPEARRPG